jgi:hypothetical protein
LATIYRPCSSGKRKKYSVYFSIKEIIFRWLEEVSERTAELILNSFTTKENFSLKDSCNCHVLCHMSVWEYVHTHAHAHTEMYNIEIYSVISRTALSTPVQISWKLQTILYELYILRISLKFGNVTVLVRPYHKEPR